MPKQAKKAFCTKSGSRRCIVSIKKLASTKFKKWKGGIPKESIAAEMQRCTTSFELAVAVMQKSREELISMHGEIPHHLVRVVDDFETTVRHLNKVVEVIENASLRIIASNAARLERGQLFAE